jgi:hypothetical protein
VLRRKIIKSGHREEQEEEEVDKKFRYVCFWT